MDTKVIIEGEAPETDSEDENTENANTPARMTKSVQGAVITGEASESDDEPGGSISSAISAMTHTTIKSADTNSEDEKFNSLLHKKLRERNRSLAINVHNLTQNVINEAVKSLTNTDQQLLKSQVTLQAAIGSLRTLNQHTTLLKHRINTIVTSNFFHNIQLPSTENRPIS